MHPGRCGRANPARRARRIPSALLWAALGAALLLPAPAAVGAAPPSAPVVPDPFIQSLLDSVDTSRLMNRIQTLQDFFTRHTWSDSTLPTTGIGAARKWAKAELDSISVQSGGDLAVSYFDWIHLGRWSRNVMAELPGTMPESAGRHFGVGAHLDSRTALLSDAVHFAPGANDDGSGSSMVMEMARLMAPHDWEASFEFHLFAGEEQGLLGSEHYATFAETTGVDIEAFLVLDLMGGVEDTQGYFDSLHVRLFADSIALSRNLERYVKRIADAYVPGYELIVKTLPDRAGRGSDHLSFSDHGFTACRKVQMLENSLRNHTANDLIDYVNAGYVSRSTKSCLAAMANLALAPTTPPGLAVEETPEGHLRLTWPLTNPEPDFAGYLVAYRLADPPDATSETSTEGGYTYTMVDVGAVNEHMLLGPNSGDSVYIGLAAVDSAGHESIVSQEIGRIMPQATAVADGRRDLLLAGLGAPHPNPASVGVELALSLAPRAGDGRLAVFDIEGRLVRTLLEGEFPAGNRMVGWDLTDASGSRVPAGIYFLRLEVSGESLTRKLVVAP